MQRKIMKKRYKRKQRGLRKPFYIILMIVIVCVYLVCNIQFWLEPIIRGVPWLLATYCFIDGTVTNLLGQEKRRRYSNNVKIIK